MQTVPSPTKIKEKGAQTVLNDLRGLVGGLAEEKRWLADKWFAEQIA